MYSEKYLIDGVVDYINTYFNLDNVYCFGPNKQNSMLEGSKAYSKIIMNKFDLPTAEYTTFNNYRDSLYFLEKTFNKFVIKFSYPVVERCFFTKYIRRNKTSIRRYIY